MREYGQIQCSFWTDPDLQSVSNNAKLLAAYLLTGPHSNGLGCYRLPDGYVMADFGWDSETLSKGFEELLEIGFAERCDSTFFVLIPKFLAWNEISNPNVAKSREKEFLMISSKASIYKALCGSLIKYGKHFSEAFLNRLETLSKGYGKQEPTQPEPTKKGKDPKDNVEPQTASTAGNVQNIFTCWQEVMGHQNSKLDDKRKKLIQNALKLGYTVENLKAAILGCSLTPHNIGQNDRNQRYDGLHIIFKDADQIDRFIYNSKHPPKNLNAQQQRESSNRQIAEQWAGGGNTFEGELVQ